MSILEPEIPTGIEITDSYIHELNINFTVERSAELMNALALEIKQKLDDIDSSDPAAEQALASSLAAVTERVEDIEATHEKQLSFYEAQIKKLGELTASQPEQAVRQAQKKLTEGDSHAAEELYEHAAEKAERNAEASRNEAAEALFRVGELARERIDLSKARDAFRRSNDLNPDSSSAVQALGEVELQLGQLDNARTLLEQALELHWQEAPDRELHTSHVEMGLESLLKRGAAMRIVRTLHLLATCASLQGELGQCIDFKRQAIDLHRKAFDDPEGTSPAQQQMLKSLEISRAMAGEEAVLSEANRLRNWQTLQMDLDRVGTLDELVAAGEVGNAYEQLQDFEQALPAYQRVVEIGETIYREPMNRAIDQVNLAGALAENGRGDEAFESTMKAVELFGEESRTPVNVCSNISERLRRIGRDDLAIQLLQTSKGLSVKAFGAESNQHCNILQSIAQLQSDQGDYEAARDCLTEVERIFQSQGETTYASQTSLAVAQLNEIILSGSITTREIQQDSARIESDSWWRRLATRVFGR